MSQHNFTPQTEEAITQREAERLEKQRATEKRDAEREAERVERNREHLEGARAAAAAPKNGPAPIDALAGSMPRQMPQVGKPVDMGAVVSHGPYRVTPSLDPKNIEAIEGYEDFQVELRVAHHALSCAQVGLEQISNARTQAEKNLAWNDYQKLLNVGGAAEKKVDSILSQFDKANAQLTTLANSLERELTTPLANSATGGFNVEIRARIAQMKTDERTSFVEKAIRSGDDTIAAAVLGAPSMLTNINPDLHKILTRVWHEKRSPDTVRKLAAVRKAIDIVLERAQLVLPQTQLAMRGTFAKLKALRTADTEAQKALLMQTADDPTV